MTKHEAAVIGAYTGILVGKFEDMRAYIELKAPGWNPYGSPHEELQKLVKEDFIALKVE